MAPLLDQLPDPLLPGFVQQWPDGNLVEGAKTTSAEASLIVQLADPNTG